MKIKLGQVITFLIFFMVVFLIMTGIIYAMASSVCIEKETVPFRYVGTDGLFSSVDKLETIEAQMDGYMEKCIRRHKARFSFSANLEYLTTPTSENKHLNQKE